MPPKKKRKPPSSSKPEIAKQHILDNFDTKDYQGGVFQNGHALFLYLQNDKSVGKTVQQLKEILSSTTVLSTHVTSIVKRSIDYYRHLTVESELVRFKAVCDEEFMYGHNQVPLPYTARDEPEISQTVHAEPMSDTDTADEVETSQIRTDSPAPSSSTADLAQSTPSTDVNVGTPSTPTSSIRKGTRLRLKMTPQKFAMQRRLDFLSTSQSALKKSIK